MFLKELKDTLKQAGFIMAFLGVMPLVYFLDSSIYRTGVTFGEYMVGGYSLLWLVAAGYLAYNMFRPEENENAVEYLLSLPVSRWELLICKTVPRIAVLFIIDMILEYLNTGYGWFWNLNLLFAFVVFSQICGFILGIVGRKSWITRLILFAMTICVFIINSTPPWFIWIKYHTASEIPYILVEFGILALILLPIYRTWDLKPTRTRELSLACRSIVPLMVLAIPVVCLFSS